MNEVDTFEHAEALTLRRLQSRNGRLQEALAAASQEIDSLSYSIAHDLRTPLMHIDGFAQLLQTSDRAVLDHESRDHLERIVGAARTMGELLAALVEYSRTNSAALSMEEVDLEDVLDEAMELVRPWTQGRHIQWQRTRLPVVLGDENLLRLVLVILVSNAVKFSAGRDPAVIEIGTGGEGIARPSDTVVFVRDNGVGFDMRYARRLFAPFQRLHPVDQFGGIGMGLAKVRRIIARHGGRVWAQAQVDGGAAFYFSLPRDTDE